jgi:isoquinoline 1-oxidoreductase beta subunit
MRRIMPSAPMPHGAEGSAIAGARPPYAIPGLRIAHHPAEIGVATGMWRSVAHSYTAFFTECFVDELAGAAGVDPLSFRMGLLGGNPRLARCLSTAAALGGWEGGGGAQGLACHSSFGSHVAMLAEVAMDGGRPRCTRIAAAVDCGRTINPDIVRQQIEGGIVYGLSATLGGAVSFAGGRCATGNFDGLGLPALADCPEIVVTLIASGEAPGGVGEIAVPPVAPAVMNAVASATGKRLRSVPIGIA